MLFFLFFIWKNIFVYLIKVSGIHCCFDLIDLKQLKHSFAGETNQSVWKLYDGE